MKTTNPKDIMNEMGARMKKTMDHTLHEFNTLHTGKASPAMVESVHVEAYGSNVKIKEVAAITTSDARTIVIQPWDKSLLTVVEKAIQKANLGFNPLVDNGIIRCPIPELSKERRKELSKMAHDMAEEGRVAIRGARRDALDVLKKLQKDSIITEDELKRLEKEVQNETDRFVNEIGKAAEHKEKELMQL